ncbi:23S rRNA (guanosine(2251)-2'-O)-methyltransferase RlmB [Motiliproteus coralliicola]|uniref:23S rRNA (guanosine-2'-O-)-methyltransferase RlmB n=1 Tax=Motiliproteus coralliicola TaxID=2283196 RepID=A0A369WVG0_9GAMM|nr:23S rRNA (guanosine(2251)-2'-O)-methyltransferase RlmB [Motiliproteus coralliicola]RDE25039.1 23S rRNA (guanosine(2251)-2'-O)-methyltransferase RlmB [Motiliproteus coralliicola]
MSQYSFGIHAVQSLLEREPKRVRGLLLQQGRKDKRIQQLIDLAKHHRIKIRHLDRKELDQMIDGVHQGVVAEVEAVQIRNETFLEQLIQQLEVPPFLLVLDGVTDPHNLGACLRTADAAGVQAVIAAKDKSAPLNATAVKVACGAADTVPYVVVTNLARTLKQLQAAGVWITGTAGEATQLVNEASLTGPMALVMGAEGSGMRRLTRENCDQLVKIPMAGSVSSLNVSVAAGVCLFEAVRQRNG